MNYVELSHEGSMESTVASQNDKIVIKSDYFMKKKKLDEQFRRGASADLASSSTKLFIKFYLFFIFFLYKYP